MSDKIYSIEELKQMLYPILERYSVEKAYLFGSYARNQATPQSDIDIVVEPRDGFRPSFVCGILDEAMELTSKSFDVYALNSFKSESSILQEILHDRVLIYDKSFR